MVEGAEHGEQEGGVEAVVEGLSEAEELAHPHHLVRAGEVHLVRPRAVGRQRLEDLALDRAAALRWRQERESRLPR